MSDYLDIITRFTGENLGSLVNIKVARKSDISYLADPSGDTIYEDIVFNAGKGFREWVVASQSGRMASKGRKSSEGISRENNLPFLIAKDRPGIRQMLSLAEDDEFIILFTDSNGQQKILGSLDHPALFRYDRDSGGKFSDLNAYECEFYCEGPDNEFFYDQVLDVAPSGPAPAIVRVNGVVVASLAPGVILDFTTDFDFDFEIVGT